MAAGPADFLAALTGDAEFPGGSLQIAIPCPKRRATQHRRGEKMDVNPANPFAVQNAGFHQMECLGMGRLRGDWQGREQCENFLAIF